MKPLKPSLLHDDPVQHAALLKAMGCDAVYVNDRYQAITRQLDNGWSMISVKRLDKEPIRDWRDLQDIKNQLAGRDAEAVELYPDESRKVDSANQYYLWVLPKGGHLPVGFYERMISDYAGMGAKQRPFEDPEEREEAHRTGAFAEQKMIEYLRERGVSEAEIDRQRTRTRR